MIKYSKHLEQQIFYFHSSTHGYPCRLYDMIMDNRCKRCEHKGMLTRTNVGCMASRLRGVIR